MKLFSLKFKTGNPPIPGFRELGQKSSQYEFWTAHVRGSSVLLVSPPGWRLNKPPEGDEITVYEVPRSECYICWKVDAVGDLDSMQKWSPVAEPTYDPTLQGEPRQRPGRPKKDASGDASS